MSKSRRSGGSFPPCSARLANGALAARCNIWMQNWQKSLFFCQLRPLLSPLLYLSLPIRPVLEMYVLVHIWKLHKQFQPHRLAWFRLVWLGTWLTGWKLPFLSVICIFGLPDRPNLVWTLICAENFSRTTWKVWEEITHTQTTPTCGVEPLTGVHYTCVMNWYLKYLRPLVSLGGW